MLKVGAQDHHQDRHQEHHHHHQGYHRLQPFATSTMPGVGPWQYDASYVVNGGTSFFL